VIVTIIGTIIYGASFGNLADGILNALKVADAEVDRFKDIKDKITDSTVIIFSCFIAYEVIVFILAFLSSGRNRSCLADSCCRKFWLASTLLFCNLINLVFFVFFLLIDCVLTIPLYLIQMFNHICHVAADSAQEICIDLSTAGIVPPGSVNSTICSNSTYFDEFCGDIGDLRNDSALVFSGCLLTTIGLVFAIAATSSNYAYVKTTGDEEDEDMSNLIRKPFQSPSRFG
jgi:TM2 domain-containing membrane protein YozV